MNKVQGTISKIGDAKQITDKFSKVEMVMITDDTYPQTLCVEWPNDSMTIPQGFKEGDIVEVDINIRGREWTSPQGDVRYFTSLNGWKMSLISGGGSSQSGIPSQALDEMGDDLPF